MESQLVWPFPMPDDRVRATYWNLHLSENGTEEQKRRLGPPVNYPAPGTSPPAPTPTYAPPSGTGTPTSSPGSTTNTYGTPTPA